MPRLPLESEPMKNIKLTTGYDVPLDGDLLSMVEAIYQEVAVRKELQHSYEDLVKEIENIVKQIPVEDLQQYFKESLLLNTVTYENEILDAYVRRLGEKADDA